MPTTEISLSRAWLSLASAPDVDPIVCGSTRPGDWTDVIEGEIRQYTGGRKQAVTTLSRLLTVPVTLIGLTGQQVSTLQARVGEVCLFRSAWGERVYCTFFQVSVHNHPKATTVGRGAASGHDVALTLYEVTYDESV